jgi:hypothetical protein
MTKRGRPKGAKNKPKKQTYIALVIDRSGSMSSVRDAAYGGINEQLNAIRMNATKGGKTFVTYIQFDNEIEKVYDQVPADTVKDIMYHQYEPRGSTSMLDAVGVAIDSFKNVTDTSDTAYLLIVISDGEENSSQKETYASLAEKIKKLESTNKWTFTYMISNQDLSVVTDKLGASSGNVSAWTSTPTGTNQAFAISSNSSIKYMSNRASGTTSSKGFYNENDKDAITPVDNDTTTKI